MAVCCREPLVAITVTVDVDSVEVCEVNLAPPPQPMHKLAPKATSTSSICTSRRFFHPKQQNATANTEPGTHGLGLWRELAVVVEVDTVRVVAATAPEGVTVAGEKLHDAPVGNPVQLNETGEANEFSGVTWTVAVPTCPAVTLSAPGETVMEKFGAERSMM